MECVSILSNFSDTPGLTFVVDETAQFRKYLHDKTVKAKSKEEDPKTKDDIPGFIETYHIDMEQFEPSDWREYSVSGGLS